LPTTNDERPTTDLPPVIPDRRFCDNGFKSRMLAQQNVAKKAILPQLNRL
jgi:hypothetical protein